MSVLHKIIRAMCGPSGLVHFLKVNVTSLAGTVAMVATTSSLIGQGPPTQPPQPDAYGLAVDHVSAVVADLDKESSWYSTVLGLHEASRLNRGDFVACQMTGPGIRIDLVQQKGSARTKRGGFLDQGWLHIVLRTGKLGEMYKALQANHVEIEGGPNAKGVIRQLVIHDPEGNEIELVGS